MSQLNPDPHKAGYVYEPTQAVSAHFPPGTDVRAIQRSLADAGFGADQVDVFVGEPGRDRLDLEGDRHGGWVQFRRYLERLFSNRTYVFDRGEAVLESGGAVVVVFTGGDAARKVRSAEVLKSYGPLEAWYWGLWAIEGL
jgi:hypothetical protein